MWRFRSHGAYAASLVALLLVAGCGTVEHKVDFDQHYSVQPGTKVVLGPVKNQTGQSFDIDVEKMLADAFSQALKERDLQYTEGNAPKLVFSADIVEYSKGDAFKRWLVPGWGATVLVVRGTLHDSDSRKVGSVDAKRTVDAGGGYTVGAWETVFRDVANDVIVKLAEQVRGSK